jgi:hypothetical protein
MRRSRFVKASFLIGACIALLPHSASAAVYTDATGGTDWITNPSNTYLDIASVTMTNDATNLNIVLNVNAAANLTVSGQEYAQYDFIIQEGGGAGGQTLINNTFGFGTTSAGNPNGTAVGASTGVNYFISSAGSAPGGTAAYSTYASHFVSGSGWAAINGTSYTTVNGATSISYSVPLADLGLVPGQTFNFDAFSSFSGANAAYDALDNATVPPGYNTPYDSATQAGTTFASTTYTVAAVPEPASAGLLGIFMMAGLARRRASCHAGNVL